MSIQSARFLACLACAVGLLSASAAESAPSSRAGFLQQVQSHFAAWDTDHDGTLSNTELDAVVMDPKVTGAEAAALAALKRAARSTRYHLPPLTLANIQRITNTPGKEEPDFGGMFRFGAAKIAATNHTLFAAGSPHLDSVRQGKLGNCFSLAPLGALTAGRPEVVKAMFHLQPDGSYEVLLGKQTVHILPPTDAEIAMTSSNGGDGVWVNAYEKAAGQARNELKPEEDRAASAIDALAKGGSAGTMLAFITGHEIVRFSCKFAKDEKATPEDCARKLSELRSLLVAAQNEARLMTCGTLKTTTPGITPNHAYAVLGYDSAADRLRLWNPHGDDFTPKGDAGLQRGYARKAGIFEIPLQDFVKQFSGLAFEILPK